MIAAFFSKAKRADDIFQTCQIAGNREAVKHQNQYSVIHISFNDLPKRGSSYEEYIARIEDRLIKDLRLEYPEVDISEAEVDELYHRYEKNTDNRKVSREGLRLWYDGYHTLRGESVYNPRSVVFALLNNHLASYWTSSGPYDEIYYYIEQNIDDVRNDLALMVSGEAVPAKIQEYAATSMNLTTRDEIFSAMVVYGFLNYEKGKVSIPNKELMDKFAAMLQKESSLGYVYRLAHESELLK